MDRRLPSNMIDINDKTAYSQNNFEIVNENVNENVIQILSKVFQKLVLDFFHLFISLSDKYTCL